MDTVSNEVLEEPRPDSIAVDTQLNVAESRRIVPIKWWASLGAVFVVFWIYLWVRWVTSSAFKTVPVGPTPVPKYMKIGAISFTIVGFIVAAIIIYLVLLKPWRREHRLTFDGLMLLAFVTMLWQDDMANFFRPLITYNSWMTNFGSWYRFIPGWLSPGGNHIAEPVLWDWPLYIYFWLPATMLGCFVMRKSKERWPQIGKFGQVASAFITFAALDFILEVGMWTRTGLYTYPGASGWSTLFRGHYYQFPVYESVLVAAMWTAFSSLRYFKSERGEVLVERGRDRIKGGTKSRALLTFLALVGGCNLIYLGYNASIATIGMYQTGWSKDSEERSYITDEQCGAGTSYACPVEGSPIDTPGSLHLDPKGQLVIPQGRSLPMPIPFKTK